jgi:hypothetical protein
MRPRSVSNPRDSAVLYGKKGIEIGSHAMNIRGGSPTCQDQPQPDCFTKSDLILHRCNVAQHHSNHLLQRDKT